jgi:hypothetical protein
MCKSRDVILICGSQGVFFNFYLAMYLTSPRVTHAFVDNLEREAVKTYTHAIHEIDHGRLPHWATMEAPSIAMK